MRRDSIFYHLFAQFPSLLFELVAQPPANAQAYRFDSIAVKEPSFTIDGVFLPPDTDPPGIVYFCEVQFQKDEQLYERLFGEAFLYFYRQRSRFRDWQAVVIYPSRRTEQREIEPYRVLLESGKVQRVYLDELGAIADLPLGVALMQLTTIPQAQAAAEARDILARAEREVASPPAQRGIIEMVTTIMVYRFTHLSRQEVERMIGITLQQTRVYQEAKAEGREEGREEGLQSGRSSEALHLVTRMLTRRFGELDRDRQAQVEALDLSQLEELAEALLDFASVTDLEQWLAVQARPGLEG